ncbi:hypothetical protein Dsin_022632 [Dipteronia sinensis]|uniref:RNase H type-1 domain-containing protein n=1 Tax=Dipteronia sinensis TaxID=43782 RepID=A0AAE0A2R6_9ROSI|nr:hypothetical protein Dsin_022632 [Dipteronia sinensis]
MLQAVLLALSYGEALSGGVNCWNQVLTDSEAWWEFLWRIKVPAKVKLLLWHASHYWVPSNLNLTNRGVMADSTCPICNGRPESTMHALWYYPLLKLVQKMYAFMKDVKAVDDMHFIDFMMNYKNRPGGAGTSSGMSQAVCTSWRPPDVGKFKMNRDTAIDKANGRVSFGIIIRNHAGDVLAPSSQSIEASFSLEVVKAMALLKGLEFARDLRLIPCSVESDAQVVVKIINSRVAPLSDVGLVIKDIFHFLTCRPNCPMAFVPRLANMAAHKLAKFCLAATHSFWMEEAPPYMALFILGDRPVAL